MKGRPWNLLSKQGVASTRAAILRTLVPCDRQGTNCRQRFGPLGITNRSTGMRPAQDRSDSKAVFVATEAKDRLLLWPRSSHSTVRGLRSRLYSQRAAGGPLRIRKEKSGCLVCLAELGNAAGMPAPDLPK
jgi:hypothetical protein